LNKLSIILVLLFIGFSQFLIAQKFADKKFYLVDSLDLKSLTKEDRTIIDSALTIYHNAENDSIQLLQLNMLIAGCENQIWIKYNDFLLQKSLQLIENKNLSKSLLNFYKKNLASCYNNLGFYYFGIDNNEKAISFFEEAIKISEEISDKAVIPTALNNIGFIFKQQGDVLRALDYYHRSLKLNKELNEQEEIALALNNIGSIYFKMEEHDKALNYFREALIIEKEVGKKKNIARVYSNIGSVYAAQDKKRDAIDYFDQSLKIYTEIDIKKGIATSLSKIATLEMSMIDEFSENKNSLLNYVLLKHKNAYQIYKDLKDNEGIAYALNNISLTYTALGEVNSAYDYATRSLEIAKKIGFPETIKNAAQVLKNILYKKREYKLAYELQELYYEMQDSMSNLSIKEATIQKQFQYQYEKKSITDSIQNSEKEKIVKAEITLKDEQIKRQTTEQYALFGGVFILIVFGGITFKRYKKSQLQKNIIAQQKQLVEAKSKEITDSINYAKRIQDSILPPISELKKQLRNSFVYYQPKDIVAGDFYWLESVGDTMLFAAADCTGHGVPGAMVSVVCNGALNRSVGEYKLSKPCEILDKTRDLVVETFERSGDETSLRDGMDISLCSLQLSKNSATLQWAGANNPIYIISPTVIASATAYREIGTSCPDLSGKQFVENEQTALVPLVTRHDEKYELIEIKPNKQPIGKHFRQDSFTNHTINLQKGDTIYIFTDGYADQFGGEKGKKLMYKPFKELLLSIQEKTMEEQKIVLEQFFENWKGSLEQVDDVCVIGVRI